MYEVIRYITSDKMPKTKDIVGAYDSLQDANMKVVNEFLFGGYYVSAVDEPRYQVEDNGALRCKINTDGSTRGHTEFYVERGPVRQGQGSRRQ